MANGEHDHLRFGRTQVENPRRRRRFRPPPPPEDVKAHAGRLRKRLDVREAEQTNQPGEPGFDPRLLLKLDVEGLADPADLEHIGGFEIIAQEGKSLTVLFATPDGLREFKARLDQLRDGEHVVRKDILYAITDVSNWTAEDRTGAALAEEGAPDADEFFLDVELWWQAPAKRALMVKAFEEWCGQHDASVTDKIVHDAITLLRVQAQQTVLEALLEHRDVRRVDLPPRYQIDPALPGVPLGDLGPIAAPPEGAPGVVVLDSGITERHPVLAPAVGDAQSFVQGHGAQDDQGHGTHVAGLALYGDVESCVETRTFLPTLRLFSGRVTDSNALADPLLVENRIVQAVDYFIENYGAKIFVLAFGDDRRVYAGGHVERLAALIDHISFQRDVLFVVPTGNFTGTAPGRPDWLADFPGYLSWDEARLLDPAPALNALTVGSLARHEQTLAAVRNPGDPAPQCVARRGMPSPFTRSGPGPRDAVKPEVVEYGGNFAVDVRSRQLLNTNELGELSANMNHMTTGRLFGRRSGTSFAAPKVAWLCAKMVERYPTLRLDTVRALVVAHARVPGIVANNFGEAERLRLVGYGHVDAAQALVSTERRVALIAEDKIAPDSHHFYDVPLPDDFLSAPARRLRRISIGFAYTPPVRRTRFEYREADLSFRVVRADQLTDVENIFQQGSDERLPGEPDGVRPTMTARKFGTAQAAVWEPAQVDRRWRTRTPYIVVTHQPRPWSTRAADDLQRYSLVVVVEDFAEEEVRLYTQLKAQLRERVRARARLR